MIEMPSRILAAELYKNEFREVSAMSMKTIFLALSVALTLLAGCGRSKPESSKTAQVDSPPVEEATPATLPPDRLPPKPASSSQPVATQATATVPFALLPPGKDPVGDAERQKFQDIAAMQAAAVQRELEQRRIQLQNQPEENKSE